MPPGDKGGAHRSCPCLSTVKIRLSSTSFDRAVAAGLVAAQRDIPIVSEIAGLAAPHPEWPM